MTATTTPRPTHSFPTVSFPGETRHVVRDAHGDTLINYTSTASWGVDTQRMVTDAERDSLIFPSWSDGSEHVIVLGASESVEFTMLEGLVGNRPGLGIKINRRNVSQGEQYEISGYCRVTVNEEK